MSNIEYRFLSASRHQEFCLYTASCIDKCAYCPSFRVSSTSLLPYCPDYHLSVPLAMDCLPPERYENSFFIYLGVEKIYIILNELLTFWKLMFTRIKCILQIQLLVLFSAMTFHYPKVNPEAIKQSLPIPFLQVSGNYYSAFIFCGFVCFKLHALLELTPLSLWVTSFMSDFLLLE